MADANDRRVVTDKPKKQKQSGRKKDALKKQRLSSHRIDEDCHCARFKCFESVCDNQKKI